MKPRKIKRSTPLSILFRKARARALFQHPQRIRRPSDALIIRRCTPEMINALEHIRDALKFWNGKSTTLDLEFINCKGYGISDRAAEIWSDYVAWTKHMKKNKKTMHATTLYASGFNLSEIEESLRIRHGTARRKILEGLKSYATLLREKEKND